MKELIFYVKTKDDIRKTFEHDCKTLSELDEYIACGHILSGFGEFRYRSAKKRCEENSRYLEMDRDEFVFLRGKLVDLTYNEINL